MDRGVFGGRGAAGIDRLPSAAACPRLERFPPPIAAGSAMDQRYVDTVRAFKVILRNLDYLEETITLGQRTELTRLVERLQERLAEFLGEYEQDEGLRVGEE
jgi:hypothetical protein